MKEVESTLKKYPNGFFKEMKDNNVSLSIYMVNKIDGGHSGMTDGRNQSNITVTIGTAGRVAGSETIRGKYGTDKSINVIHGSGSREEAIIEIKIFFKDRRN